MKNKLSNSDLAREIGPFSATILVVANMVGTGIFTTSGFIMEELRSPYAMLLCWFVGGIFALCGALCYGELGSMFPMAGGEYVFLRESLGKCMAFLSGWISLIVGFSAPIAASAIAFSTYFFRMIQVLPSWGSVSFSPITLLAIAVIVVFSMVHYHSLFLGTRVQNILTVFKVNLIVILVIMGFWLGNGSISHFSSPINFCSLFQERFPVSLIFVSFAYSGWNATAYLGGEIKNPGRNIPLALFAGTIVVICLYMLLNVVYIYALPVEEMNGVLEIGTKATISLFGKGVAKYFTGAIAIALLSVLSAMIMTGPRVYYAMAKDGVFFNLFGEVDRSHRTPAYSIFLQAGIAIVMVITASFDKLLLYIGFTLSLFAMLTVLGMVVLRFKKPSIERGYKTFGYPVTPLLFILGNVWIIYFSLIRRPVCSLFGLGTIALGLLIYFYFRKGKMLTLMKNAFPALGKQND